MLIFTLIFQLYWTPVFASESVDFQEGIKAYDAQDFQAALDKFSLAAKAAPDSPEVLLNLGLAALKMEQTGLALAAWRRAINLRPNFSEARQATTYAIGKFESLSGVPTFSSLWDDIRQVVLNRISFDLVLFALLLFLLSLGVLLVRHRIASKNAFRDDGAAPVFSNFNYALIVAVIVCLSLVGGKIYDYYDTRAMIIKSPVNLKSGPSAEHSDLTDLVPGTEVAPMDVREQWVLVETVQGVKGWVERDALFVTSGRRLW